MKALNIFTFAGFLFACAVCAEEPAIAPGSPEWREIFDPPFTQPTEIPAKSELRKTLFDLLRPRVEKAAKRPVQFEGSLRAFKNWALFMGRTVDAKGDSVKLPPIGNDDTVALWLRTREGWKLVDFGAGVSDAGHIIWAEQYGTPKELLSIR